MSEEEKKAIEKLKWYFKESSSLDIAKQTYTVLNLIEKQQEQLNKEKEKNKELENKLQSFKYLGMVEMVDKYFVDKDKIRKKIEEYNKQRQETGNSIIYTRMVDYIDCLNELLGE